MFKVFTIAALLFGTLVAQEQNGEKEAIRARLRNFETAMNQGDLNQISSFFTNDPQLTDPKTGKVYEGKEEVDNFFKQKIAIDRQQQLQLQFKILNIKMEDPNTAIVKAAVEFLNNGNVIFRNARRAELVKENGNWFIDTVTDIEVNPAPALYTHLKEIDWLVGDWKDRDDNVTIYFKTNWDRFKNFILQKFDMRVFDVDTMQGLQIIGWDPIENKIRSWVYDSDGGVGTGLWTKSGESWQVAMEYVMSDGKKGSATNIYTKVNDESYKFASIDRKVGGVALPNVEPTLVSKDK